MQDQFSWVQIGQIVFVSDLQFYRERMPWPFIIKCQVEILTSNWHMTILYLAINFRKLTKLDSKWTTQKVDMAEDGHGRMGQLKRTSA